MTETNLDAAGSCIGSGATALISVPSLLKRDESGAIRALVGSDRDVLLEGAALGE